MWFLIITVITIAAIVFFLYGSKSVSRMKVSGGFLKHLSWKKILIFVIVAYVGYLGWYFLWATSERTAQRTVTAPLAPYEVSLEPGESSDIFMLNRNGAWNAYIDPCHRILPYVVRINERMIGGVLYFDGYKIVNSSNGTIVFRTWQEQAREGHVPPECT